MDNRDTEPDANSLAPEAPQEASPKPARRRRGALSFVVIFLLVTVVLLALGRNAVNTRFMNWYLFQVAGHTSWILDIIGYSSELEDSSLYRDRPAAVRAELDAWRSAAAGRPQIEYTSEPLTAYETWQYRSLLLARQYAQTNDMAALTAPQPRPDEASDEVRIAYLRDRMDALTKSTRFDGPGGTIQVMPQGLGEFIQSSESALAALERGEWPDDVPLAAVLSPLEEQIASALEQQHAYLKSRTVQLSLQIHDRHGPTVDFLARAGLTTQLQHAEAELNGVEQATGRHESARESRVRELKERIETLKSARETAAKERDLEADKDLRFRFNVVPDCGALPSMSIFLAAMIAFPTELWRRLLGLLIGLPLLYTINIVRLTCLALIGAYSENEQVFEFAHEYVWQAVYIVFVVIVWLLWVEFIVKPKSPQQTKTHPP